MTNCFLSTLKDIKICRSRTTNSDNENERDKHDLICSLLFEDQINGDFVMIIAFHYLPNAALNSMKLIIPHTNSDFFLFDL